MAGQARYNLRVLSTVATGGPMRRYLIILIAILVGLIVLVLIDKLANQTDPKKGLRNAHIWGATAALAVLAFGFYWLEMEAAAPTTDYIPAKVIDGQIVQPDFVPSDSDAQ